MKRSSEYLAWQNMVQRCTNRRFKQWKDYGGRGIRVCAEWTGRGGFGRFLKDVGPKPMGSFTLDRVNNKKGYCLGNVEWRTYKQQNRNSRKNVFLTMNGERKTISEWCELTGLIHNTLRYRIVKLGWTTQRALTTPPRKLRRKIRA